MMLIELFTPSGSVGEAERRDLAERLLAGITYVEGAGPEAVEAARSMWQVLVREVDCAAPESDRYVARVSFPEGMLNEEARAHVFTRISKTLEGQDVWTFINVVPEGDFGRDGKVMRSADLIKKLTRTGTKPTAAATPVELGADTAIDPVCGMTVELSDAAITLDKDGATYAFCNVGCREVFAEAG